MARGYDETKPVRIWVGNYGHYNAGYLVGDWFSLPMDRDELWAEIRKACRCDRFHEEVGCFDYECDVRGCGLNEYMSIDSANALAAAIEHADDWEMKAAEAYISQESSIGPLEAANIIMDSDSIPFYGYDYDDPWMSNEEKMGYTMMNLNPDLQKMLEDHGIDSYFDYESFGRDCGFAYTLTDDGYLDMNGDTPSTDAYDALEILESFGYYEPKDYEDAAA